MKIKFDIPLRYKILLGIIVIFLVFISISVFSVVKNREDMLVSKQLQENIALQNGFNDMKNIIFKDFQLTEEIIEKVSENELENKWKDHVFYTESINELLRKFENYPSEYVDISGISSIYKKQIVEPYEELHKKKLKEIIISEADSATRELMVIKTEIEDIRKELKNNVAIINIKISKNEDIVKEKLSQLTMNQYTNFESRQRNVIFQNIIASIVLLLYLYTFLKFLFRTQVKLSVFIDQLKAGKIPENLPVDSKDEIGIMAKGLFAFTSSIKKITLALDRIGENNFEDDITLLGVEDELGNSFMKMKKNLMQRNEEAKKMKDQEDIQNWSTIGIAKFGEILRLQTKNNEELSYNIIKALIEYVNANQGGVFIVSDDENEERHLILMATYAYGRKKFKQRTVKFGEGLVGTTALEGQSTYITNLPDDYIEIESYLGHASPKCLLLVPLKVDDKIFGIIEIASFNEFKPYEIKFIEDLAETIASTLATAKINAKTAELLEKSKQQSEAMLAQEEEMRQNLEELQSTQEEAARRERILQEDLSVAKSEIERLRELIESMRK